MTTEISSDDFKRMHQFRKKINNAKPEDITIDGHPIDTEIIEEWKWYGLSNYDMIADILGVSYLNISTIVVKETDHD